MNDTLTRLNKRMAELGLCSRREADDWIAKGWVKVNGEVAVLGKPVSPLDRIEVDKLARGQQDKQVTIILHKPMGFVSGQAEDGHTPAINLIEAQNRWRDDRSPTRFVPRQRMGLAPARVARQLIGEDSQVEKEYLVRVQYGRLPVGEVQTDVQALFPPDQLARLCHGLALDGQALKPAVVDWQNPEQLRFVLREGKKRQIRRMCELVGLTVVGLKRVRIGRVTLGQLPVGQWRYLAAGEVF